MGKILQIKGMHCVSCELIIKKEIKNIDWIKFISISNKTWNLKLKILEEKSEKFLIWEIEIMLEKNWFSLT